MNADARTEQIAAPQRISFNWLHPGWGIGSLGAALFLNGINFLLLFFLTTVLHINPAVAGLLITAGKIWDMVTNPLVGMWSDRSETTWGRRRPFLLAGAVVTAVGFAALFGSPQFSGDTATIAYSAGCFLLVSTGYTLFNVPYMAMPAEMFDNYRERSVLISYRVVFIAIGSLVAGTGGKLIVELAGGGRGGYAFMGLLIGAGILLFMSMACWGTRRARFTLREKRNYSFQDQWRTAWANKPFRVLLLAKFTQLLGLASVGPIIIFTFQFVLGYEKPGPALVQYGLVNTLMQIASLPIWLAIARRIEKRRSFMLAALIFTLGTVSWLAAVAGEPRYFFLLRSVVTGFAASGLLLMGQSMLPDVIEYDYRRTGLRREGVFSGFYSFVEKTAFAIAPAIVGFILQAYHFDKMSLTQPPEALHGILLVQAVLPALYFGVSVAVLWFYTLTEAKLKNTGPDDPSDTLNRS